MPSFSHQLSVDLDAPPAAVWSVIADYRRDPEWREGVRMTVEPAGAVVDGVRVHAASVPGKRRASSILTSSYLRASDPDLRNARCEVS